MTTTNWLVTLGSHAHRPRRRSLLSTNLLQLHMLWVHRWMNSTVPHEQQLIFRDGSKLQPFSVDEQLRVYRSPGECFREDCQTAWVHDGGSYIHVWGAVHSDTKSCLSPKKRRRILYGRGTIRRIHCCGLLGSISKINFVINSHQEDNATPQCARIITDFLQQQAITKMEQPAKSWDCKSIEHFWMNWDMPWVRLTSPSSLDWFLADLLDRWSAIPVKVLQCCVVIIWVGGGYPILNYAYMTQHTYSNSM